jgi:chromosome segregation ATPase
MGPPRTSDRQPQSTHGDDRFGWLHDELTTARRCASELEAQLQVAEADRTVSERLAATSANRVVELEAKVAQIVALSEVDAEARRRSEEQAADIRRQQSDAEALVVDEERRRREEAERHSSTLQRRGDELELRAQSDAQLQEELEVHRHRADQLQLQFDLTSAELREARERGDLVASEQARAAEHTAQAVEILGSKLSTAEADAHALREALDSAQRDNDVARAALQSTRDKIEHERHRATSAADQAERAAEAEAAIACELESARHELTALSTANSTLRHEADKIDGFQQALTAAKQETLQALESEASYKADLEKALSTAIAESEGRAALQVEVDAGRVALNDAVRQALCATEDCTVATRQLAAVQDQVSEVQHRLLANEAAAHAALTAVEDRERDTNDELEAARNTVEKLKGEVTKLRAAAVATDNGHEEAVASIRAQCDESADSLRTAHAESIRVLETRLVEHASLLALSHADTDLARTNASEAAERHSEQVFELQRDNRENGAQSEAILTAQFTTEIEGLEGKVIGLTEALRSAQQQLDVEKKNAEQLLAAQSRVTASCALPLFLQSPCTLQWFLTPDPPP